MSLKSLLIGTPIQTRYEEQERLSKIMGLAILSADALSSVAYATEQIITTLIQDGVELLGYSVPLSIAIASLIAIVAISYYQTIQKFPSGGGAYTVAKNLLGRNSSLIAGSSLMIDYLMTVTVSVTAGVAAITSAFPVLYHHRVALCLLCVLLLTIANLRGTRESGKAFSVPVYLFLASLFVMLVIGVWQEQQTTARPYPSPVTPSSIAMIWLLLRSFSSGCVALSGIEAVANGVQAFRPPEARNAGVTLIWMAILLGALFLGITFLADRFGIIPNEYETVLSKIARMAFGQGAMYYIVQIATCLILILAANTAYAGFPRLSSMIAKDGFLPKQLTSRGDKLVFSNGILLLSILAALLILFFKGNTNPLIPLYTVGVFSAFTFSQAGMVKSWLESRDKGWVKGTLINGIGALTTSAVLLVVAVTKFVYGAWIVLLAVPVLIFAMRRIHRHYTNVASQLDVHSNLVLPNYCNNIVIVPISGFHKASINAIHYAKFISKNIQAVYVAIDPSLATAVRREWEKYGQDVGLTILDSPWRSLINPLLGYIDKIQADHPSCVTTVVFPALVPDQWWQQLLHNQTMMLLRMILLFKRNVVTISVPTHLEKAPV